MARDVPLVFACSGCSEVGQIANQLALELDRRGVAEMSCLAGLGAKKPQFLRKLANRRVWIIDGCPIECSLGVFQQIQEQVHIHIRLHDLGIRKNVPLPQGNEWDQFVDQVLAYVAQREK